MSTYRRLHIGVAAMALAATLFPATARAEPTRAEYVAQADAICQSQLSTFRQDTAKLRAAQNKLGINFLAPDAQQKADSPRFKRLFKPVGRLYKLAGAFENGLTDSLSQLAVPSADAATITQWLASRRQTAHALKLLGKAMPHRKVTRILHLFLALFRPGTQTPQAINDFGFQYCVGERANPLSG